MNNLIKITTNDNDEQLVSGRELHEFLGVATPYKKWVERMIEYGFAENTDFDYCDGCFTGKYPIEVPKEQPKDKFEEKLNKFSAYYQVLD